MYESGQRQELEQTAVIQNYRIDQVEGIGIVLTLGAEQN